MKSDVTIATDKDDYVAGDVIKGSVTIWLTQEVKIKDLLVKITGHARVCWNEQRSYTKGSTSSVSRKNTETYLDQSIVLLKKDKLALPAAGGRRKPSNFRSSPATSFHDVSPPLANYSSASFDGDDGIFVPPGEHVFNFEFALPKNLPSSYAGRWGHVRYSVRTILERPWKFDIIREKEFILAANLDLNDDPELLRPVSALGDFRSGILCFRGDLINLEVRLSRRGYMVGERVPFQVVIENNTRRKLHEAKVSLVQHVVFKAGQKSRKISHVLSTLTKGEISPWKTDTWENDALAIPDDVIPSTDKHINAIQIKYTFTLSITYSTWRDEYVFPVPLIIGTRPFKKAVVHSHLSLLGFSISPGASPSTTPTMDSHHRHNGTTRCRSASKPCIPSSLLALDQLRMRRASALPVLLSTGARGPRGERLARLDSTESSRSNPATAAPRSPPALGQHAARLSTSQPIPHQPHHSSASSLNSRGKRRTSNAEDAGAGGQLDPPAVGEPRPQQTGNRKRRSRGAGEADATHGSPTMADGEQATVVAPRYEPTVESSATDVREPDIGVLGAIRE